MVLRCLLTGAARRIPRVGVRAAEPAIISKAPAVGAPSFLTGVRAAGSPSFLAGVRAAEPSIPSKAACSPSFLTGVRAAGSPSFLTGVRAAGSPSFLTGVRAKAPAVGAPSFLTGVRAAELSILSKAGARSFLNRFRATEPAILSATTTTKAAAGVSWTIKPFSSRCFSTSTSTTTTAPGKPGLLRYIAVICAYGGAVTVFWYFMSVKNDHEDIDYDGELPESVDWSRSPAFPHMVDPFYNYKCGSCWAVIAIKSIEAVHAIETGEVLNLSIQQLIDCATVDYCRGLLLDKAYNYIKKAGLTTEKAYPGPPAVHRSVVYRLFRGHCKMKGKPIAVRIEGYERIPLTELDLMKALQFGPVAVYVNVNDDFAAYRGGVLTIKQCPPRSVKPAASHCLLLVGYGKDSNGRKYWKLMNSWGAWWGLYGYVKFSRSYHPHGVAGITEYSGFRPVLKTSR